LVSALLKLIFSPPAVLKLSDAPDPNKSSQKSVGLGKVLDIEKAALTPTINYAVANQIVPEN
jgi:hypothetical protein